MSPLSVSLTAIWAALHTLQYGFGISAFNGIQDAVICPATQGVGEGWLKGCVPLTVSRVPAGHLELATIDLAERSVRPRRGDLHAGRPGRRAVL
jgi:hypothetical protein